MKIMEIFEPNQTPQSKIESNQLTNDERLSIKELIHQHLKDNPNADLDFLDYWDDILEKLS